MSTFRFHGTVTLKNVTFFIDAASEAEAVEKAKRGDYSDYDDSHSFPSACEISPDEPLKQTAA